MPKTVIGAGQFGDARCLGLGDFDFWVVGGQEYDLADPAVKKAAGMYPDAFEGQAKRTRTRTRADRADSDD